MSIAAITFNAAADAEDQAKKIISEYDFSKGLGDLIAGAMGRGDTYFYLDHLARKTDLNKTETFKSYRQNVMGQFRDVKDVEYRSSHNGVYFWLQDPNMMKKIQQELIYRAGFACSPNAY